MEADINSMILKNLHLFALFDHVPSSKNISVANYWVVRCRVLFSAGQVCALCRVVPHRQGQRECFWFNGWPTWKL